MSEREKQDMARRIDKGILLAQTRLIEKAKRENLSLVVRRNGCVVEIPAIELYVVTDITERQKRTPAAKCRWRSFFDVICCLLCGQQFYHS